MSEASPQQYDKPAEEAVGIRAFQNLDLLERVFPIPEPDLPKSQPAAEANRRSHPIRTITILGAATIGAWLLAEKMR